jgi:type IV secretory pathway TraG/TraD family ATPase VirD4
MIINIFIIVLSVLAAATFITGILLVLKSIFGYRELINQSMNYDLEIVRVAKEYNTDQGAQNPDLWKEEIAGMEQLLATFVQLKDRKTSILALFYGKPTITLEIANPAGSEEILFYIAVPKKYRSSFEKQVHSYFPDALVEKIEDYTVFSPGSHTAIGIVNLRKPGTLPIKTYEMMDADPLNEITNAFSKLETEGEGASIQVVLRDAGKAWRSKGKKIAHEMQQGKQLKDVQSSAISGIAKEVGKSLSTKSSAEQSASESTVQLTPEEQELVKTIESKTVKTGFKVNIRLVASAQTKERAEEILAHMESAFSQFENPGVNHFTIKHIGAKSKDHAFNYIFRAFNEDYAMLLGVEEIASIFHFPISTTETPKIKWLKAGSAPPPTDVPTEGVFIGTNNYRGVETKIFLSQNDRRRHYYVIGQTGTGKSTILIEMAKQDVKNGHGLCYIDPHGDAIEEILESVPKERAEDVVHFDPSDVERPFGLNMLEFNADKPEEKTFVVNEVIGIFDKLFDLKSTGGPKFEQYMRNAMLLIMDDPDSGSTLMEIPKVLADDDFRKMKLSKCKNETVRSFWMEEAEKAGGEAALANMVPYITSKLTPFLSNDMMRPIISQQKTTLDFREIMDGEKILLINLSKGKIGETNSHLLGMIIVGKLLMAGLGRVDMPEDERKDFYLYIDEFQNVTTDSISQILSEARKYRLALILAHQFIGQLSEDISKAVFGNVGSMASYRVGPEDAEFLQKQFEPVFTAQDLINVDNYNYFAKLLLNGVSTTPFNLAAPFPTKGNKDIVEPIKELSRLKYGRDKDVVEQEVTARSVAVKQTESLQKEEHYWK